MGIVRTLRQQWLGALGLIVGLTGVAFGATGQPTLLGRLNRADKPTVIQNNGNGPAATFKAGPGEPPFSVGSGVQVPNLNAAKLGGKAASAFATAGSSYSKTEADTRFVDTTEAGNYHTKSQANSLFAPISGSANYVASTTVPLIAMPLADAIGSPGLGTLVNQSGVTAPAAGVITARVFGHCDGTNTELTLSLGATSTTTTVTDAFCTVTVSRAVAFDESLLIDVELRTSIANIFRDGVLVASFSPG